MSEIDLFLKKPVLYIIIGNAYLVIGLLHLVVRFLFLQTIWSMSLYKC